MDWPFPVDQTISSIQRGTISISAGNASNTAIISAVVLAKSIIMLLGAYVGAGSPAPNDADVALELTDTTTVTATRGTSATSCVVSYEVVQYT